MTTQPDASHLIQQLQQAINAAEAHRTGIQALTSALSAIPFASDLTKGMEIRLPCPDAVHEAAHSQIHSWAEDALLPGMTVALPFDNIRDALRERLGESRWADFRRKWSEVPLQTTAAYIVESYAPRARTMMGSQIFDRIKSGTHLREITERSGRLVVRICARSATRFAGRRRIECSALRILLDVIDAIDAARRWLGENVVPMNDAEKKALELSVGEQFTYRARLPVPSGYLVLFKEYVELVLTPEASGSVSLFLAEFHQTEAA